MSLNAADGSLPVFSGPTEILDLEADRARLIADLRLAIQSGRYWYAALLETIGRWRLPAEDVEGRQFQYLIADEAFDWLLLAERLIEPIADLVPEVDRRDLLFYGNPPVDVPEDIFKQLLGPTKYRAHLNYLYGVVLEESLLIAVQRDIEKENRSRAYREDRRLVETLHQRLYGKTLEELRPAFRSARQQPDREEFTQAEWKEFIYWLFKLRLRYWDKARIASDTRKAIQTLDCLRNERRKYLARPLPVEPNVIEAALAGQDSFPDAYPPPPPASTFERPTAD